MSKGHESDTGREKFTQEIAKEFKVTSELGEWYLDTAPFEHHRAFQAIVTALIEARWHLQAARAGAWKEILTHCEDCHDTRARATDCFNRGEANAYADLVKWLKAAKEGKHG